MTKHVTDLAAAAVAAWAVAAAGSGAGASAWWVVLAATLVALSLILRPIAVRVARVPTVAAIGIAGIASPAVAARRAPIINWVAALTAPLALAVAWAGSPPAAAGIALAGVVVIVATAWAAYRGVRGDRAARAMHAERIAALAPQFAVYTSRASHSRYQIAMWQDLLVASGATGIVIVRDRSALAELAPTSPWPIVLLPRAEDLERVLAPSLRAVFYVNMLPRNLEMVTWRGPRHIYLGHGDSDKPLSSHPGHAMFDEIWVAGQHSIDRYADRAVLIEPSKFHIISRPQLAELATTRPADTGRPTVLYAPTWNGYNSLTRLSSLGIGYGIVESLIASGARVIFRPHPMSVRTREGRREVTRIRRLLREDAARAGTAHLWGTEATGPAFVAVAGQADLLVTDPSSVIADFLVTGRPTIVVEPTGASGREPLPSVDEALMPALYRAGRDLMELTKLVSEAVGSDPKRAARVSARAAVFGEEPEGGWTARWQTELARVLDEDANR